MLAHVSYMYLVENWKASKVRWPHLVQCDFLLPAKDGLVDLLIGVDYADLYYLFADIHGNMSEPIAHLGPLGWIYVGPDLIVELSLEQENTPSKHCYL